MTPTTLHIVGLAHDIAQKKSYINFVWSDDPAKRLGLEVPFGTPIEKVEEAARIAVADFASDVSDCEIKLP